MRITRLDGTPNAVTKTFSYDPQFSNLLSATDPLGHTTSFSYDQFGNLVSATDPLGHQTMFSSSSAGQVLTATDALNNTVQFGYFGADLVSITDPMGNVSTRFRDSLGRVVSSTDAHGHTATTQYNALNLITQFTDPLGNHTSFTYDGNGNVLALNDALNHTTTWTYDDMDRVQTRTDPLQRQESYTYDLNGNLASSTDRKGQSTSVTYDALNRRTMVGYNTQVNGGNTIYESTISYTYDAGNRMTQAVDSTGGTISEAYDNLDRLISETSAQGSISYGYDNAGRRTTMQVAGQAQVSYSYDNADRLTQITQGSSNVGFQYDNVNRRSSLNLPNGVSVSYSYDHDSHITGISYNFGSNTLGNLTYSYDSLGRRTQVGGSFAGTGLPSAVSSATYDAANELTNWNGTAIPYDLNGNMQSDGTNNVTWNARNQVATLNNVSLQYDAFGRRTQNLAGTSFLYDGPNSTQELLGATVNANLLTGGIDELFARADSSAVLTPLQDALGSTIALVDSSGNVETTYSYDPFGNTVIAGTASANPTQYTGRENEANGLYYYRARYYSANLGRFISQDPAGFRSGQTNLYAYVGDSPINFRDPLGLYGGGATLGGSTFIGGGPGGGMSAQVGFAAFTNGNTADFLTHGQWIGPDGGFYGNYDNNQTGGGGFSVGPGFMLTSGNSADDLAGPFNTTSYYFGLLSVDFAYSPDTGVWVLNVSTGYGLGFAKYCTNTYTLPVSGASFSQPPIAGRNCGCNTGYLQ